MTSHAAPLGDDRQNLFGLDLDGLARYLGPFAVPSFHARQIFRWLYARRRLDPATWTDLPSTLRRAIARSARIDPGVVLDSVEARDGTVKYRVGLAGGSEVECVRMVHADRVTVCLSSQVGCALDCDFCLTGKMGLERHLTPGEIVGQVLLVQSDRPPDEGAYNVVFMGMGEPLHNYDGVMAAVGLLTDPQGFGLSRRRITVSTSGLAPAIERLADEPLRPRLAVSLNATTDEVRNRLMPVNRKYDIHRLFEACRTYTRRTDERFTFEYVLLEGVNDSDEDLRRLAGIVHDHRAKLNLIPFNPVPGRLPYRPPSRQRVVAFRDRLLGLDVPVSIRWSRGMDARAACGQLALPGRERDGASGTKATRRDP